jgi:hypothetical protein
MGAGPCEAELSSGCLVATRPALSRHPGTAAKNRESGSGKASGKTVATQIQQLVGNLIAIGLQLIAINFEKTA